MCWQDGTLLSKALLRSGYSGAGLAAGVLKRSDLADWVKPGRTIRPGASRKALYDARFADYLELYTATNGVVHRLAASQG
jgi:xylulokinase